MNYMKNFPEKVDIKKTYLAITTMLLAVLCVDDDVIMVMRCSKF